MENQTETTTTVEKKLPPSQRFTNRVIQEYGSQTSQAVQLTLQQKRLVQGYFICVDRALTVAETNRQKKSNSNAKPYTWNNVNMTDLALDAVHYARMGLDMQERNHLFPIPYANKRTGKYDITFTVGYSGIQYIAEKYALTPPKSVTVEAVYSNDTFKAFKKSKTNPIETYEFEITNPFDRGKIIGGFGYIEYEDSARNMLVIMNMDAIKKRAGKNASPEFWGTEFTGKKATTWENGQKVSIDAEGWLDEMVRKTLVREVYSSKYISRDPSKIDDDYQHLKEREVVYAQAEIDAEAAESANTTPIDIPQTPPQELPQAPIEQPVPSPAEPQPVAQEQPPMEQAPKDYEEPDF